MHTEAFALVSLDFAKVVAKFHEFTVSVWSFGLVFYIIQTNPSESSQQKIVLDIVFHWTGNLWEQSGDSNITSDPAQDGKELLVWVIWVYSPPVLRTRIFRISPLPQLSGLQIVEPSVKVQLQINPMPVNKLALIARELADVYKNFSHTKILCSNPWVGAIRNLRYSSSLWINYGVAIPDSTS